MTRSRKHTLSRHEGTDLSTYTQLVDYKTLFQKMRDVLMRNISRRDIELLTPNTANTSMSMGMSSTQQQYMKHEAMIHDSQNGNGITSDPTTTGNILASDVSLHENGVNNLHNMTGGGGGATKTAGTASPESAKIEALPINESEVDELTHISMPE